MSTGKIIDATSGSPIEDVVKAEAGVIEHQRKLRGVDEKAIRIGLALSGGGIRSASFALGVLQALQRKDRLKDVDYLSTVSGGGYIGSSLTWFHHLDSEQKSPQEFPFGEKGRSSCSAVKESGDAVELQPDKVAFIRQHGEYLTPSRQITKISLAAVAIRNAMLVLAVYGTLIITVMLLGIRADNRWQSYPVVEWFGFVPKSFVLSLCLLIVFALLSILFSLATWFFPYFLPESEKLYYFRVKAQSILGFFLAMALATLLLGTLPHTHELLRSQHIEPIGLASLSTFVGMIGAALEFVKQQRPMLARLWPKLSGAIVWITGLALIYGVLLSSYILAVRFNHITWLPLYLGSAGIVIGGLMNSNMFGIGRMYRDRLMEAFLPDPAAIHSRMWKPAYKADVGFLKDVCTSKHLGPYHLINTNVVLTESDYPQYRGRGGSNFVMSSLYCGSEATGWHSTSKFCGGSMTLATAMAISGAAINPNAACGGQGPTRNRLASFMLALFNVRLGYWVRNPHARPVFAKLVSLLWPNLLYPGLRQGLLGTGLHTRAGFIELTDGGHFDNTGIYELIRRRVQIIILSLASADQEYGYDDLADVLERVRVDFGVIVRFDELFDGTAPGSCVKPPGGIATDLKLSESGHSIGIIHYPGETTCGRLIVLKSAATARLPVDALRYAATHPDYPNESTVDQFFDERQFEAYRETGYAVTRQMLDENRIKVWF